MNTEEERKQDETQFEQLIEGLINQQYGCCDDFVKEGAVLGLRNNIQNFNEAGQMKASGLGNKDKYQQNQRIRGDQIKWLETESQDQFEVLFQKKVGDFINYLNRTCYTSINKFECHYASYEQKSFYKRHLDQFKNDKGRKFSLILYLNDSWQSEDGGMLSLYPADRDPINIAPIGGRMVFFRSDEMEHEVHPSFTRDRVSIAGWFKS